MTETKVEEIARRIARVAQAFGLDTGAMIDELIEQGLRDYEAMAEQAERVCRRCQNADGDEESPAHPGEWYCRPCFDLVNNEGNYR